MRSSTLTAALLLLLLPTTAQITNDIIYMLMVTSQAKGGTTEYLCVQIRPQPQCTFSLTVSLELRQSSSNLLKQSAIKEDFYQCVPFQLPDVRVESEASIRLQIKGDKTAVNKVTKILVKPRTQLVFIESDKPIYKPGQTVNFRIVSLNTNFLTYNQMFPTIELQDSRSNRIGQWLNVSTSGGLVDLSYPTNTESPHGFYIITVWNQNNEPVTETFEISEYVLPKFEVRVDCPPVVTVLDTAALVIVCAKYTHGQPVDGSVKTVACRSGSRFGFKRLPETNSTDICKAFSKKMGKAGCVSHMLQLKDFALTDPFYQDLIRVHSEVEESGTGVVLKASGSMAVTSDLVTVSFEDAPSAFKPGMNCKGKVKVIGPNNNPLKNKTVTLTIRNGDKNTEENLNTNNNGVAAFSLKTDQWGLASVTLEAQYQKTGQRLTGQSKVRTPSYPTAYWVIEPFYSNSRSFVTLELPQAPISCNKNAVIRAQYLTQGIALRPQQKTLTFYYMVMSRGTLAQQGTVPVTLKQGKENRGAVSFQLKKVQTMTPVAQVVIYTLLHTGEAVADSMDFPIQPCLPNKVSLSFMSQKEIPGVNTTLKLKAEPGSLCSLRAIDQSLLLMKPGKELSVQAVFNLLPVQTISGYPSNIDDESTYCLDSPPGKEKDKDINKIWDMGMDNKNDRGMAEDKGWVEDKGKVIIKVSDNDQNKGKNVNKDQEKSKSIEKDKVKDISKSVDKDKDKSMVKDKGLDKDQDKDISKGLDKDISRIKEKDKESDKNEDKDKGRVTVMDEGKGMDKDKDRFKDNSRDMEPDSDEDEDEDSDEGRDMQKGRGKGKDSNESGRKGKGRGKGRGKGKGKRRGRGRGRNRGKDKHKHSDEDRDRDKGWPMGTFHRSKRSISIPNNRKNDVYNIFKNIGIKILTNAVVKKFTQCHSPVLLQHHMDAPARIVLAKGVAAGGVQSEPPITTVRKFFPETWIWDLVPVGQSGMKSLSQTVPDTITTWEADAFCTSPVGFGVAPRTKLTAFQPFFVSLSMPSSVVRGEVFTLKATVFNYLQSCIMVKVTLAVSQQFTVLPCRGCVYTRCLCVVESFTFTWTITPQALGEVTIKVTAEAVQSSTQCGNKPVTAPQRGRVDTVINTLLVLAEGTKQTKTYNELMSPRGAAIERTVILTLPSVCVSGSASASVSVLRDLMGRALKNLASLLAMPYGCGEQNMLLFAPNIFILQYLKSSAQLTAEIRSKAETFLISGYQRELTYKHTDGSYSAFGMSDPSGNTWLTAFVMKSFAGAKRYIFIAELNVNQARAWLAHQQQASGCFASVGQLFHTDMKGGVNDEVTLSAYITAALLELGVSTTDPVVAKSLTCLRKATNQLSSTYALALLSYTFTLAGEKTVRRTLLTKLNEKAIVSEGGRHWSRGTGGTVDSLEVEMTSYALLALLSGPFLPGFDISYCASIVQWLVQQQNAFGGFTSTQDTIVALQALAKYSTATYSPAGSVKVTVTSPSGVKKEFTVKQSNRLLLQESQLQETSGRYKVKAEGTGSVYVQFTLRYNIPPPADYSSFSITAQTTGHCNLLTPTVDVTVTVKYNGKRDWTNMVIIEVKLLSGFRLDKTSVKQVDRPSDSQMQQMMVLSDSILKPKNRALEPQRSVENSKCVVFLQKDVGAVKRVDEADGYAFIYLTKLKKGEDRSYRLVIEQKIAVQNFKPAVVKVYDYYETGDVAVAQYSSPCATK